MKINDIQNSSIDEEFRIKYIEKLIAAYITSFGVFPRQDLTNINALWWYHAHDPH